MSRVLILKTAIFSVIGLAAGAGAMSLLSPTSEKAPLRRIAAVDFEGLKGPRVMGKHLAVLQVALQAPEGIPDHENQEVTLVGSVRLNRQMGLDVRYRWELPAGVQIVSGHVEDAWAGLNEGDVAQTRLTVTGFSKDDLKLVALHGYVEDGETLVGNSATITSRPEDSLEMLTGASGVGLSPKAERPLLKGKIVR